MYRGFILKKRVQFHYNIFYSMQSAYFASMFSGHWKESNEDVIRMEIVDPNINLDSLRLVLGSLYQDELTVEPAEVIPLLATATLLQLDGVIFFYCL